MKMSTAIPLSLLLVWFGALPGVLAGCPGSFPEDDDIGDDDVGDDDVGDDDVGDDDVGDDDVGDDDTADDDTADDDTADDDTADDDTADDDTADDDTADDDTADDDTADDDTADDDTADDDTADDDTGDDDSGDDDTTPLCNNPEVEPNDSFSLADYLGNNDYRCGTVDPAGDVDWYEMSLSPWTLIDYDLDADVDGSLLYGQIRVYEDDGSTMVHEANWTGMGNADPETSLIFVTGGTYYVTVDDEDGNVGGPGFFYTLYTTGTNACGTVEIEPNDDYTLADYVAVNDVACGTLECDLINYDVDWFEFYAIAGETWTFDMDAYDIGSPLNAQLALYDTDGTTQLVLDEPLWPDDPYFSYSFTTSGTYYLEAESDLYLIDCEGPYMIWIY